MTFNRLYLVFNALLVLTVAAFLASDLKPVLGEAHSIPLIVATWLGFVAMGALGGLTSFLTLKDGKYGIVMLAALAVPTVISLTLAEPGLASMIAKAFAIIFVQGATTASCYVLIQQRAEEKEAERRRDRQRPLFSQGSLLNPD